MTDRTKLPPRYHPHGGGCCGIRHIAGMDNRKSCIPFRKRGGLTEIVLNTRQINNHGDLLDRMYAEGYHLVSRFSNSTGSMCYVFHYNGYEHPIYRAETMGLPAKLARFLPEGESGHRLVREVRQG